MAELTARELHEICELTYKLTELRQNECKHLCIENFSPKIFAALLETLENEIIEINEISKA